VRNYSAIWIVVKTILIILLSKFLQKADLKINQIYFLPDLPGLRLNHHPCYLGYQGQIDETINILNICLPRSFVHKKNICLFLGSSEISIIYRLLHPVQQRLSLSKKIIKVPSRRQKTETDHRQKNNAIQQPNHIYFLGLFSRNALSHRSASNIII
jgi:hypothetical protein